jgi:hypothetical protein
VYSKWQARAFPVLPGAPLMPSAPVQAINAMAKGPAEKLTNLASNHPLLPYVTGQTPGEWALQQRRNLELAYPSEPTAANTVAGIVGDTATALPMLAAGVPLPVMGAMEAQSELGGAHADVAQRRESGENVTPTQEAVYSGARAAKGFATMMAGGAAATKLVPRIAAAAGESALARGAAAVAGDVATQSALGAGGRVAENVTQQGVFGKDHAPGTFEGVPAAAAGGAVGGLVYAPLTYHHARNMPAGHEPPPAEIPPPPPGFTMEAPPESPTPRQTPDAVAAVRESRMNDLAAERQRRTLERRNPVTIATENALDALDAADARTGTEQPPTQQRASGEAWRGVRRHWTPQTPERSPNSHRRGSVRVVRLAGYSRTSRRDRRGRHSSRRRRPPHLHRPHPPPRRPRRSGRAFARASPRTR